jgi:hypothetical protein
MSTAISAQPRASIAAPDATTIPADSAGRVATVTAWTFLALLATLHVVKPELDPSWRMVSEYAIGRHGWLMIAAFLSISLSLFSTFVVVRPFVETTGGKIGLGFLVAAGAALAAAGVFVSDPITATRDQLTTHGNLHGLSAMVGIPGFPIAALLIGRSLARTYGQRTGRRALLAAAHLPWVSLALMVATIAATLPATGGRFTADVPSGFPNRLVVVSYAVWVIVVVRRAAALRGRGR